MWLLLGLGCWLRPPEATWQVPARLIQDRVTASEGLESGTPVLTVQSGHGPQPLQVAASPDGRYIATGDSDGLVVIWDAWRGRQLRALSGPHAPVSALAWWLPADHSPTIVVLDSSGGVGTWSPETGQELATRLPDSAHSIAVSPDGHTLALSTPASQLLTATHIGSRPTRLDITFGETRVAFADNQTLAAADPNQLHTFALGAATSYSVPLRKPVTALSGGGGWVVTGDQQEGVCGWSPGAVSPAWCLPIDSTLRELTVVSTDRVIAQFTDAPPWERWLRTGTVPRARTLPSSPSAPLSDVAPLRSGVVAADARGTLWSTADTGPRSFSGSAHLGRTVALSGNRLLASSSGQHSIWNLDEAALELHLQLPGAHVADMSADGTHLTVATGNRLRHYDLDRYCTSEQVLGVTPEDIALSADGSRVLVSSAGQVLLQATDADVPIWSAPLRSAARVALSPDGEHAAAATQSGVLVAWNGSHTHTNQITRAPLSGVAFWGGDILVSGQSGEAGAAWRYTIDAVQVGAPHELPEAALAAVAIDAETAQVSLVDGQRCTLATDGTTRCAEPSRSTPLLSMSVRPGGEWLAGGRLDGGAELWRRGAPDDALHLVTFAGAAPSMEMPACSPATEPVSRALWRSQLSAPWAVLQPSHSRYDTDSLERNTALHWVFQGTTDTAPLAALPDDHHKPALLHTVLSEDSGAVPEPVPNTQPLPPAVTLPTLPRFAFGEEDLTVCADEATTLRILLNAREIHNEMLAEDALCHTLSLREQVNLHPEENTLSISTGAPLTETLPLVVVTDGPAHTPRGGASAVPTSSIVKQVSLDDTPPPPTLRPGLYVLAVGLSRYTTPSLRLRFADDDADAIATLLERGAEGPEQLFRTVEATPALTDTDAPVSASQIEQRAEELIRMMSSPDDIFAVFLAGHGVTRADGEWYFLTSEAPAWILQDPARMPEGADEVREFDETTLSASELTALLQASPALRQVVVLDTCASEHAAHSLSRQRGVITDMTDSAGLLVLAASSSLAFEILDLEHGLLTQGLLNALHNEQLLQNFDNYWFVGPLFDYAAWEVHRLSGGDQLASVYRPSPASFHVGRWDAALDADQRTRTLGHSMLIESSELNDPLGLSAMLDALLAGEDRLTTHNAAPRVVGHYTHQSGRLLLTVGLKDGDEIRHKRRLRARDAADAAAQLQAWVETVLEEERAE